MRADFGFWRYRPEIADDGVGQRFEAFLGKQLDAVNQQVRKLAEGDIRAPLLPTILMRGQIQGGAKEAQDDFLFRFDI